MAGKQTGLGDHLLVSGYDVSGDIGAVQRVAGGPAPLEVTDITQSAPERLGGRRDGGIDFTSWFNVDSNRAHAVLSTLPRTDVAVSYCHGYVLGGAVASEVAKQIGYDPTRAADGSISYSVASAANGYGVQWGLQLTPGLRTDTTDTNGASVDNGASTALGAQFFLHLTGLTGADITVAVEDSANNTDWLALSGAEFAEATAVGAQRIAVTGTVRRYLRVVTTGDFTSATFLVNGIRNDTATVF